MKSAETGLSQQGGAILWVILSLMVLTLTGVFALNLTGHEIMISGNDRCYRQNLYGAEGVVVEAEQVMNNTELKFRDLVPGNEDTLQGIVSPGTFDPETEEWTDEVSVASSVFNENDARYTIRLEGVAPGSNLDMGLSEHKWHYTIYGRSNKCNGLFVVKAGVLIVY